MPSVSGVNLVSGALQSSLLKVQKKKQKLQEEGTGGLPLKKKKKGSHQLNSYCDSIGSKFATLTADQFRDLGNSLAFKEGGSLGQLTEKGPGGAQVKLTVLKQAKKGDGKKGRVKVKGSSQALGALSKKKKEKEEGGNSVPTPALIKTKVVRLPEETETSQEQEGVKPIVVAKEGGKLDKRIKNLLKEIRDKTIGKNKRKRLIKRLKRLQKGGEVNLEEVTELKKLKPVPNGVLPLNKNNLLSLSSCGKSPLSGKGKVKAMGPDAPPVTAVNGHGSDLNTNHQLPEPKRVLFPKENIVLGWRSKRGPGAGFHNLGNTCYLNSSLQALFHVPAFVNWILNDEDHRKKCNGILPNQTPCIICVVYFTLQEHSRSSVPVRPRVLDKLKVICKNFGYFRQEDAHEFLRLLLEGMERSYLTLINGLRLDNRTKETNPLSQIFGGYIRTEVTCQQCNFVSTTFQPSAELQLDIRYSTTLEDALQHHFRKERLDNNDYKCEKCRRLSQATKQYSLEVPPMVLCLQLKRFTLFGTKISKRVHCNRFLNMSRYLHKSQKAAYQDGKELKYRLVALVTHLGHSPNCGHYTAIAECADGLYYQFDDSFVHVVSNQTALNNDAYVIIYEMDRSSVSLPSPCANTSVATPNLKPSTVTSATTGISKSRAPITIPFRKPIVNGSTSTPLKGLMSNTDAKTPGSTTGLGLSPNSLIKPATTPNKINVLKPGVSLTNSARLYSTPKPQANSMKPVSCIQPLVPYNDVDNEDSESDAEQKDLLATNDEPKLEIQTHVKIIGPQLPSRSCFPKIVNGNSSSSQNQKTSPEVIFGVKRKLEQCLGPAPATNTKEKTRKKSPELNATSEWTITPSNSGYSSDPETSNKKKQTPKIANFARAKSVDRLVPSKVQKSSKSENQPIVPLIPNKKSVEKDEQTKPISDLEVKPRKQSPNPKSDDNQTTATECPVNTKRKRSASSDSSSGDDKKRHERPIESKKKRKKKKSKPEHHHKSKKRSSSSDSDDSSSGSSSRRHHKHSKSKTDCRDSNLVKGGRDDRDATSAEREQILRKSRNPSRSPPKPAHEGKVFNPSQIERREKSIVAWNGSDSLLSKSIDTDRKAHMAKVRDAFDEELDKGRDKKQRSRSPPREDRSFGNKFQSYQDRQKETTKWSSVLDGYGADFKHHKDAEQAFKDRKGGKNGGPIKPLTNGEKNNYRPYNSDYKNNNRRDFRQGFNNPHGRGRHHHHDRSRKWKHKNHSSHRR